MSLKKLSKLAQLNFERENRTLQQLKKIKEQGQTLNPVPERWEDFVQLCTIRSGGQMKQFRPYEYQRNLSRLMDLYTNLVVVKSRQLGTTQLVVSKHLHRACRNPAHVAMSFMRNADDASGISRRARQMLVGLENFVKAENDNVGFLKIKGLGELHFKNSSREGSRSYDSVLDFLFDESAFSLNIGQIYSASSPSTALAGDNITKVIVSTPSAKSGWYWDKLIQDNPQDIEAVCEAVAAGELYSDDLPGWYWFVDGSGVCKVIIHWRCHPVYSQVENYLEYRMQQDGTDWETVLREYDLRFVDSAVSVFSFDLVNNGAVDGLEFEKKRDKKAKYYLGIDTATIGNDYVCGVLLKLNEKYSTSRIYRKRHETSEVHMFKLAEIITEFEPEAVGIEVTGGVGRLYLEQLSRQFPKIKFEAINTTQDSKQTMIAGVILALEMEILSYPAKSPLVEELLSFRRQGKKLEAPSGKHDDTVMALAFALQISPFRNEEKQGTFAHVLDADIEELLRR